LNMMRQTGSVLGVAVFGSLIAAKGRFTAGLHTSLLISIAVVVLAALVVWAALGPAHQGGATG
jgi:MFS transporter, DHA2 family, methylenomycin A resistance protein